MKIKNKYSKSNENIQEVKFNLELENYKILNFICTIKGISKHQFINDVLNKEFNSIDKAKLSDVMADLEKL